VITRPSRQNKPSHAATYPYNVLTRDQPWYVPIKVLVSKEVNFHETKICTSPPIPPMYNTAPPAVGYIA